MNIDRLTWDIKTIRKTYIMKKIKSVMLILCCFILLTGFTPNSNNLIPDDFDSKNVVVLNSERKNIRFVKTGEAYSDTTDDLLFVPIDKPIDSNGSLYEVTPNGIISKIALFIGDQVVGYVSGRVIEYVVGSPFGQLIIAQAASVALAVWPYALAVGVGAVAYHLIINVVNNSPELKYLTNSAGCVWNAPTMGGRWICPMRNISLNHYE